MGMSYHAFDVILKGCCVQKSKKNLFRVHAIEDVTHSNSVKAVEALAFGIKYLFWRFLPAAKESIFPKCTTRAQGGHNCHISSKFTKPFSLQVR